MNSTPSDRDVLEHQLLPEIDDVSRLIFIDFEARSSVSLLDSGGLVFASGFMSCQNRVPAVVSGATVSNRDKSPWSANVESDNNVLAPNEINGLWIRGNTRTTDLELPILYPGEAHEINTYQIYSAFTVGNGATLTIHPGVILKFIKDAYLQNSCHSIL